MDNKITSDWIDRYNENELDPEEREKFRERMLADPLLRTEVNIDLRLNQFLGDKEVLDLIEIVRSVSENRKRRIRILIAVRIAACFLCLIIIGGIYYSLSDRTGGRDKSILSQSSNGSGNTKPQSPCLNIKSRSDNHVDFALLPAYYVTHHELIAENFKPLPEFESLAGSVTRSNLMKLISPKPKLTVHAGVEICFSWRSCNDLTAVTIMILNNKGLPVQKIIVKDDSSYIFKTNEVKYGLYYWKIMLEDNLVYLGKLTIIK